MLKAIVKQSHKGIIPFLVCILAVPAMAAATYTLSNIPLNHFIYIIQENITFDHYFGTFPGADGIPADVKLAYRPGEPPTLAPFHLHQTSIPRDLNHSWQAAHVAADGGKMDGFLWGGMAGSARLLLERHAADA